MQPYNMYDTHNTMKQLPFTDPQQEPAELDILHVLGKQAAVYQEFMKNLSHLSITPQWNYYKDGKAWLCKLLYKKKNLGWMHIYPEEIQVTVYFSPKYKEAVASLQLPENIWLDFEAKMQTGKLVPLSVVLENTLHIAIATSILMLKCNPKIAK